MQYTLQRRENSERDLERGSKETQKPNTLSAVEGGSGTNGVRLASSAGEDKDMSGYLKPSLRLSKNPNRLRTVFIEIAGGEIGRGRPRNGAVCDRAREVRSLRKIMEQGRPEVESGVPVGGGPKW